MTKPHEQLCGLISDSTVQGGGVLRMSDEHRGRPHERLIKHYSRRSRSPDDDHRRAEERSRYHHRSLGERGARDNAYFQERQRKREGRKSRIWPRTPSRSRSPTRTPSPEAKSNPKEKETIERRHDEINNTEAEAADPAEPHPKKEPARKHHSGYGGQLLPGEGSAMAAFVEAGARIPRRGEIGLDANTIAKFESSGYVMSGSRHAVMNAVRLRKENQVIGAEGRRRFAMEALAEKAKREEEIVKGFKHLINERLRRADQQE